MIGYKVFTAFYLKSVNVEPFLQTNYIIGEKISAKPELLELGYGLVYFETKEQAKIFITNNSRLKYIGKILTIKIISPMSLPKKRLYKRQQDITNLKEFKAVLESTECEAIIETWPPGTAMCETIIIQRE